MAELVVEDIRWCSRHGHPYVVLRATAPDRWLAVAISVDHAEAMSTKAPFERGRTRIHALLEAALSGLRARLTAVELCVGPTDVLYASLHIEGSQEVFTLPVHFADGLILSSRCALPLSMADEPLERISGLTSSHDARKSPELPSAFRKFFESLDSDGLGS